MLIVIVLDGQSRSFPEGNDELKLLCNAQNVEIVRRQGEPVPIDPAKPLILVELKDDCLGDHVAVSDETANIIGFCRYRNGRETPSKLVELVRHARSSDTAISVARTLLEKVGLEVVVCADQAGRIIDRLAVPKYNAALRFLDEGLATQSDLDLTCKLGLGYPDGPVERIERGGLPDHFRTSRALFEAYGTPAFAPAGRARMASNRKSGHGEE